MHALPEPPKPPTIRLGGPSGRNPALLHNMSCRPDANVNHTGTHHGGALRIGFAFAPDAKRPPRLTDVLPAMGFPRAQTNNVLAYLERHAAEPCALLAKLPPVAAVHANAAGEQVPGLTDDPLLVLAVLTRCSGALFLRDRPPCVTADRVLRSITLIAPKTWNPTS
jgi:hypothetical protein